MARTTSALVIVLLAAAVGVVGCKQGVGERCEVERDCQSGYTCRSLTCQPLDTPAPPSDASPETSPDHGAETTVGETPAETPAETAVETSPEVAPETAAETAGEVAPGDSSDASSETSNDDVPTSG